MTNGRSREQPHEWAERRVVDHEFELGDHQSRIEEIEDRLRQVFPTPNTQTGGAQRMLLEVPRPASILAIGARGQQTTDGRPVGPGGFGLATEENLGVRVRGRTCVSTDGLTIVHGIDSMRLLTHADLGVGATGPLRIGTNEGGVEITAGSVQTINPAFTVVPSQPIPAAPTVDTATPRSGTETAVHVWDGIWAGLRTTAWAFQQWQMRGTSVSAPSIAPQVARIGRTILSGLSAWRARLAGAIAAAEITSPGEMAAILGPSVQIHAAGGVNITARGGAEMFGGTKASCSSPVKAELRGGVSAAVYSPVQASCYGVAGAKLKSEGVAEVSGRYVVAKGSYCEMQGRTSAALTSAGDVAVIALEKALIDAPRTVVKADHFFVGANRTAEICAQEVMTRAERTNYVHSDQEVRVEAGRKIDLKVEQAHVKVFGNRIEVDPGGRSALHVERGALSYGTVLRITASGTTIRNRCNLG